MNSAVDSSASFEALASHWIRLIGVGIEIFGVFIIVLGIIWSTRYILGSNLLGPGLPGQEIRSRYHNYKISIGRSLLLGLEVLVAADIVKTIAIELTFESLGLLAGLVVVRTFLSWTLTLEIENRWPWKHGPVSARATERQQSPPEGFAS